MGDTLKLCSLYSFCFFSNAIDKAVATDCSATPPICSAAMKNAARSNIHVDLAKVIVICIVNVLGTCFAELIIANGLIVIRMMIVMTAASTPQVSTIRNVLWLL